MNSAKNTLTAFRPIERIMWGANEVPDEGDSYQYDAFRDRWVVDSPDKAVLVSSLTKNGTHAPILDIDYPAELALCSDGRGAVDDLPWPCRPGKEAHYELFLAVTHDCSRCECQAGFAGEAMRYAHHGIVPWDYDRGGIYLDLFFPAKLLPSATEGHFHLYLDTEMTWSEYAGFLEVTAKYGITQGGYARRSVLRGMSFLRWTPDGKKDETRFAPPLVLSDPAHVDNLPARLKGSRVSDHLAAERRFKVEAGFAPPF